MKPIDQATAQRMALFIERCALGQRLDAEGLNHDDNDLMTLAGRSTGGRREADTSVSHELKALAFIAMQLHVEIGK